MLLFDGHRYKLVQNMTHSDGHTISKKALRDLRDNQ